MACLCFCYILESILVEPILVWLVQYVSKTETCPVSKGSDHVYLPILSFHIVSYHIISYCLLSLCLQVIHKAFLEVNEEGSEAAAATAVGIAMMCMPPTVMCNHPFIFTIRDNRSQAVLFMGRLQDPTK